MSRPRLTLLGGEQSLRRRLEKRLEKCLAPPGGPPGEAPGETILALLPNLDRHGRPDLPSALGALGERVGGRDRVLVVSSSEAVAPLYGHPGLLREKSAKALLGRHPDSDRWCRHELALVEALETRGAAWHILRPAPTPHAGGRDPWSRLLARRMAAVPMGFSPPVQLLGPGDLASALEHAAERFDDLPAILHVAPEDAAPLRPVMRAAGVRALPVPTSLLWLGRLLAKPFGGPGPEALDRLRYPATVTADAFAEHGFRARRGTLAAAVRANPVAEAVADAVGDEQRSDPFGLDLEAIARLRRGPFRFFHDLWWRIDVRGLHHLPREGPAVLLGVHRGLVPFDAMMALDAIAGETGRIPRFLIHPALLRFPFIGDLIRGLGGVVACRENADWVLERGEILGLFPEGVRGAFAPYRDAYRIHRFGRAEFVRLALRHRAVCSLFVTLGSAEVFPILATVDWRWWKSWSGWPTFPITPTPLPLPVKWHTLFLPPLHLEDEKVGAPDSSRPDTKTVKRHAAEVRRRLETTLFALRRRRRSWFRGRILTDEMTTWFETIDPPDLPAGEPSGD